VYFAVGLTDKCGKDAEERSTAEHTKYAKVDLNHETDGTGGRSLGMNAEFGGVFSRISCISRLV